jgi:hypothetical protein
MMFIVKDDSYFVEIDLGEFLGIYPNTFLS